MTLNRIACLALALTALALPARAQSQVRHEPIVRRIGSYVAHHKVPLAADALLLIAGAKEADSTLRAQRLDPTNPDQGFWLHPNRAQAYTQSMIGSGMAIAMNHLAYWHYAHSMPDGTPDKAGQRFFVAMFSGPMVIHSCADIAENEEVRAKK